ncbi:MAG: ceramidase domain-containing protein [Gemmatimonadota bacterium]
MPESIARPSAPAGSAGRLTLRPPGAAAWALALALAVIPALIAWRWLGGQVWDGSRPATCIPSACFCEAVRPSGIRQPSNTLSSFAFLPIAFLVLGRSFRRGEAVSPPAVYSLLYAGALFLIGLGSAFYHASITFVGQVFDVSGMYLLGTFAVLHAASRLRPIRPGIVAVAYLALNAILVAVLLTAPVFRRYLFALLIALAIGLELRARRLRPATAAAGYLLGAVGLVAAGFLIWTLDLTRVICAPFGVVQGHAVWHVLTALGAGCLWRYYELDWRPAPGRWAN